MADHQEAIQAAYWDREAKRIGRVNEEMSVLAKREIRDFFTFIGITHPMRVLEVGCGAGRFTLPLLRAGHTVTGTEVSPQSLEELREYAAKENLGDRLTLVVSDFAEPLYSGEFDLVLIGNVIHHFNPEKKQIIFNNIVAALKPTGTVVAWEPNAWHPLYPLYYGFLELTRLNRGSWQAEKGIFQNTPSHLHTWFTASGVTNIVVYPHTFVPLRLGQWIPGVYAFNRLCSRIPGLRRLSAYLWVKGTRV